MKAWYVIGIVMALIPLYFRTRVPVSSAEPGGATAVPLDKLLTWRRLFLLALLGSIGALVYAWSATPPL